MRAVSAARDGVAGRNGPAVESGHRGRSEALDRQVHADGELEDGHGEGVQQAGRGRLARAAEEGWKGSVADARDYELLWPG